MSSPQQLLATKFCMPTLSHPSLPRPRLTQLLQEIWQRRLVLISAPPGFGKTTLLATWIQGLPQGNPLVAWLTLDEADNEPRRFWTYLLTALDRCRPGIYQHLLATLQEEQALSLDYLLTGLINTLAGSEEPLVLVLDEYQVLHEPAIHTSLAYLIEHQPSQLHVIVATRLDPPLPLNRLRARGWLGEVRTNQLRCTLEEATIFLREVMHLSLTDEEIKELQAYTEGWIAELQLAALSFQGQEQAAGMRQKGWRSQRYILDYLIEEVVQYQPAEVQIFLLHTSILDRMSAPLCDAVMERSDSQEILEYLERTSLFVASLEAEQRWYRCCTLVAEALRHHLEQTDAQEIPGLYLRASRWYATQKQTTEAVRHALCAQAWEWAADLIETVPYRFDQGEGEPEPVLLRQWLDQLPPEVVLARPRLSLVYAQTHYLGALLTRIEGYLRSAETQLTAALAAQDASLREQREHLLGEVLAFRAYLDSYYGGGQTTWEISNNALAYLAEEQYVARGQVAFAQFLAAYSQGEVALAACHAQKAGALAEAAGNTSTAIVCLSGAILSLLGQGKLHEAWRMSQQAVCLGEGPEGPLVTALCWIYAFQADILQEWNRLDEALERIWQAIHLGTQSGAVTFVYLEYTILARIYRAQGDLAAASEALEHIEYLPARWSNSKFRAIYFTQERIRLWLERGEGERAARWLREPVLEERSASPLAREQEEVSCIRVLLAQAHVGEALRRLAPLLHDAQRARRAGSLIPLLLLQASAFQMNQQESEALTSLKQAIALAEPEGYIRMFIDEKELLATLLSRLREQEQKQGPTPYLDVLVAARQEERQMQERVPVRLLSPQPLLDPLTNRELEVLQLLARGTPNQEIAEMLVVTVNTVKRHLSNIFLKLDVNNRTQAVIHAHSLGLLSEEQRHEAADAS